MSIQNSINFISDISINPDYRNFLNTLNPAEVKLSLIDMGYEFSDFEFEECISLLHVKCQFEEQATSLFEIINWFKLLMSK